MKQVILDPIYETTEDYEQMENRIAENWRENLYLPLIEALKLPEDTIQNATSPLIEAIKAGRVKFNRGAFSGKFNAGVSKELKQLGAKWDRKTSTFRLPYGDLDEEIRRAITLSEDRFFRVMKRLDDLLRKWLPEKIADKVKLTDLFSTRIFDVDKQIRKSLKGITVQPELSEKNKKEIAAGYSENMKLYIKDWTADEIKRLRKLVMKQAMSGERIDDLAQKINDRYGVSKRKAEFLARQETALLMAEFKKTRYVEAGSDGYYWTCVKGSPSHPVRPMHKALDGQYIKWSSPPVVNDKGDRKHAGCDYNCRCTPKVAIKF